jgi:DNA-nicking Smr family endonuclease
MSREGSGWKSRYTGIIEPNTKVFMEEFGKDKLNHLELVCIQMLAFKKDKPYTLKNVFSVELRIDTVKFYKLHSFRENDFFDDDAMILPVVRVDVPERDLLVSATEIQEAMQQAKPRAERTMPRPAHKKKKPEATVQEVDLHIHELLDNTTGMSAGDMLNYQLDVFRRSMNEHLSEAGHKIVFIHGKGDGILRSAIEKELRTKYKNCAYQDASFREYGFGATMVTIHR